MLFRLSERKNGQLDFHHDPPALVSDDQRDSIHRYLQENSGSSSFDRANTWSSKRIAPRTLESRPRYVAFCDCTCFPMVGCSRVRNIPTVYGK